MLSDGMIPLTRRIQQRITAILFISQSLFSAAMIASFTLTPIIAAELSGSDSAAGIPNTVTLLSRAAMAFPIGWLMDRVGRRLGLSLGYGLGIAGSSAAVLAIVNGSFLGFCVGVGLVGMGRGAIEQNRFAAAEVHLPHRRAKMIGLIIFASTIGAIGGPLLVDPSGNWVEGFGLSALAGPYTISAGLMFLALALTFALLRPDPLQIGRQLDAAEEARQTEPARQARSLRLILGDRSVQVAIAAMVIGQLVMVLIMVITPLHMDHNAHSHRAISWVIMAHTLGMFGLSGVTGWLIDRYGRIAMIIIGAGVLAISALLAPISVQVWPLAVALFLLGLGWNFCFIAGSSLLSDALNANERGRVQGANEMLVALAAGMGSLSTGAVFAYGGIIAVSAVGLACALALIGATVWQRRRYGLETISG